jgi:hypothetical protein
MNMILPQEFLRLDVNPMSPLWFNQSRLSRRIISGLLLLLLCPVRVEYSSILYCLYDLMLSFMSARI